MFESIAFDPTSHTYQINGQPLTSVTATIKALQLAFDAEYWAERKAQERGVAVQVVLDEWEASREAGLARGTAVHHYIEAAITRRYVAEVAGLTPDAPAPGPRYPEMDAFDRWLATPGSLQVWGLEWVIGCPALGVAGTLDALLVVDDQLMLWDWKTGGKFRCENRHQRLLPPFDDLPDCEWTRYSLQVSLYWLILNRHTDLPVQSARILHLAPSGRYQVYTPLDLRERAANWLLAGRQEAVRA
jgi:hypothetical protein